MRAVELFRAMLKLDEARRNYPPDAEIRARLAGFNLACWCPAGAPCHADILLDFLTLMNTEN